LTVIHLITGLGGGGAEHMVLELSRMAKSESVNTLVISITDSNKIAEKFLDDEINHDFLSINSLKEFRSGFKRLKSILGQKGHFVLHCHMFHAAMLGMIYKLFVKNVPIVFTMHTNTVKQLYRRFLLFFTKSFRNDIIFSTNSKKWYLNNRIVIPNGVDLRKFNYDKIRTYNHSERFSFLFLGRLSKPKNPLFLINLIDRLTSAKIDNFVIDVVGDGPLKNELTAMLDKSETKQYINFHGFKNDVIPFLHKSNCLILPSLWEGLPVSIIEAAASKLPVIATPVGSIPEFLNNNNAYLVDLDHFHEAMMNVLSKYDQAVLRAESLYNDIISTFDIQSVFKSHLKLYHSVI